MVFVVRWLPTKRACGQVGNLKRCCPNVRRYKLLILSYLPMFKTFPSAETKVQKNYWCSITSVRPTCHKPMLAAGFLGNFIVIFHQLSCPKCTRTIPEKNLPLTERDCGRWGNWNSSARTSADVNYCCSITYQCPKGFRPPKQKYNKITNVQSLTSAPLATNPCYRQCFSSDELSTGEKLLF